MVTVLGADAEEGPDKDKKGNIIKWLLSQGVHVCELHHCFTDCCSVKRRFCNMLFSVRPRKEQEVIHPKPTLYDLLIPNHNMPLLVPIMMPLSLESYRLYSIWIMIVSELMNSTAGFQRSFCIFTCWCDQLTIEGHTCHNRLHYGSLIWW